MSLEIARQKLSELTGSSVPAIVPTEGLLLANAIFPNEFEFYTMSFELVDSSTDHKVTDRFVFPVNPDRIDIDENKITTIKKSFAGITAYTNNSFTPKHITITGSFGRRFRLLVGNKKTPQGDTLFDSIKNFASTEFLPTVKTGYGSLKNLEYIYNKATTETGGGKPYIVNFYNLSFNQSWVVKLLNFKRFQSKQNNMIWEYSMTMVAIGEANQFNILGVNASRLLTGALSTINTKIGRAVSLIEQEGSFDINTRRI